MRYFTPELYVALQTCDTPSEARQANLQWEESAQRYHAQLADLSRSADLPDDVRHLLGLGSLHDAEVREIGVAPGTLVLVLEREGRAGTLLLRYALVNEPTVDRDAFPVEHHSQPTTWLYDEVERDPQTRQGQVIVYWHCILLSDGVELRLRFSGVEVLGLDPLPRERPARRSEVVSSPA